MEVVEVGVIVLVLGQVKGRVSYLVMTIPATRCRVTDTGSQFYDNCPVGIPTYQNTPPKQ